MSDTYRAMCEELVDALDNLLALVNGECPSLLDGDRGGSGFLDIEIDDALTTARALLAQPVEEGPTDEETEEAAKRMSAYNYRAEARLKKLDHLAANIDFAHNWKSTPKGLQWLKLMDEQGQDEYESGV